jgi:hypothetical protein
MRNKEKLLNIGTGCQNAITLHKMLLQVSELEIYFLLQATDEDLDDELTYTIVADSMSVTDNSLQNWVDRNPFKISGGNLQLNFNVEDNSLRGIFKFEVRVTDKG